MSTFNIEIINEVVEIPEGGRAVPFIRNQSIEIPVNKIDDLSDKDVREAWHWLKGEPINDDDFNPTNETADAIVRELYRRAIFNDQDNGFFEATTSSFDYLEDSAVDNNWIGKKYDEIESAFEE